MLQSCAHIYITSYRSALAVIQSHLLLFSIYYHILSLVRLVWEYILNAPSFVCCATVPSATSRLLTGCFFFLPPVTKVSHWLVLLVQTSFPALRYPTCLWHRVSTTALPFLSCALAFPSCLQLQTFIPQQQQSGSGGRRTGKHSTIRNNTSRRRTICYPRITFTHKLVLGCVTLRQRVLFPGGS